VNEAADEFRRTAALQPDYAPAHYHLGDILCDQGRFAEALVSLRRAHELGAKQPGWAFPSARRVREAEDLLRLDRLTPALLSGAAEPADAEARARAAGFLQRYKGRFAAAARFWDGVFRDEPDRKDDLASGARYDAACAAAQAGCGRGEGAAALSAAERARWRRRALEWLREDFTARRGLLAVADGRAAVVRTLRPWVEDADLAGVRDAAGLVKLPAAEQAAWRKLWADVAAVLTDQ
jgi:tetratricopeptide (TPR) repeat protein